MMIPAPLQAGDRVALVAPCSPVDPAQMQPAAAWLSEMGYEPVIYPSCRRRENYLAGDDASRAADLHAAFADPCIKAVIAMRGGYGGARLAECLDYDLIRRHPKLFCGFSDVTVLHGLLQERCGLMTFHTPMPSLPAMREDAFTAAHFAATLRGEYPTVFSDREESGVPPLTCLCPGRAKGILTGGNLTVIAAATGTPYQWKTEGRILFLEDVGERAYAVDRMLRQLRDSGQLAGCAGILLGNWQDCGGARERPLADIFMEYFAPLGIPVLADLPCGHGVPSLSLPLGAEVTVEG